MKTFFGRLPSQAAFRIVWERGSLRNLGTLRVKMRTAAAGAGNDKEGCEANSAFSSYASWVSDQIISYLYIGGT